MRRGMRVVWLSHRPPDGKSMGTPVTSTRLTEKPQDSNGLTYTRQSFFFDGLID